MSEFCCSFWKPFVDKAHLQIDENSPINANIVGSRKRKKIMSQRMKRETDFSYRIILS
jgi:hypothetical protein